MPGMPPLRPGEKPFDTGDASPFLQQRQQQSKGAHGYGDEPRVKWDQPRFGATEEQEEKWANKVHLGDVRRQRQSEQQTYNAARRGQQVETDDPVLQQVAEYGEEMHRADRRHDFMIGLGAFGRSMTGLAHLSGDQSNRLARASRRVPVMRHHR